MSECPAETKGGFYISRKFDAIDFVALVRLIAVAPGV